MSEKVRFPIIAGMLTVHPWEPRREPCEWGAILKPTADGDIEKAGFLERGENAASFHIDQLYDGAAVVFAADYIIVGPKGGKKKTMNRWYGVVRTIGKDFVEIERYGSEDDAVLATSIAQEWMQARTQGTAEPRYRLKARRDQLRMDLSRAEYQLGVDALLRHRRFDHSDA